MTGRLALLKLIFLIAAISFAAPAVSADQILSAEAAFKRMQARQLTLIDVRSPKEWRNTGVARNAKTITIHDPLGTAGFVAKVKAFARGDLNKPIALICAVGVRTTRASQILRRAGFKNIYHVREGMFGNPKDGPGWLKRGLPVVH